MKLPVICSQCLAKGNGTDIQKIATVELRDDDRYELTCPKGHHWVTFLQQQKFEVLFEIGAYAITDGYYREAVSSFASSLERVYEFFIRAVMHQKNLNQTTIDNAWRDISAQSERQLGGFIVLYTAEFGRPPKTLNNDQTRFRNDVIHKGKIPSRAEALKYGQAILDVVRTILRETTQKYPDGTNKTIVSHLAQSRTLADKGKQIATLCLSTIVSLSITEPSHHKRSLEEAISGLLWKREKTLTN